jgi:uncharacterized protein (DUF1778 family)
MPRPRTNKLEISASTVQKARLAEAAKARQMNVKQFVLSTSLDAADRVLSAPAQSVVPDDGFDQFCRRLDDEANVILALKAQLDKLRPFGS